jgi:acyl-CoA synthetase (NDP forming)
MKQFFSPESIAVIGASPREGSLGRQIVVNLLYGFTGRIYPVNPGYTEIQGLPCFARGEDTPDRVDLANVIGPAPAVPGALETCAA